MHSVVHHRRAPPDPSVRWQGRPTASSAADVSWATGPTVRNRGHARISIRSVSNSRCWVNVLLDHLRHEQETYLPDLRRTEDHALLP